MQYKVYPLILIVLLVYGVNEVLRLTSEIGLRKLNTRTAEKKKSCTAEEGKFTLYLYIRFYTR